MTYDSETVTGQVVPHTEVYRYSRPCGQEGETVEFRLIYRGQLPAAGRGGKGGRVAEKHAIRKEFHKQLKVLWFQNNFLRSYARSRLSVETDGKQIESTRLDDIANEHKLGEFRFVPLVTESEGLACSLDILFLRRDNPGNLIESGGDLDNRIKVLFDALRKPEGQEVNGVSPSEDENPFYVLLEDDVLVNQVNITTDRLLVPMGNDEAIHDVMLVIRVQTIIADSMKAYWAYGLP